MDAPVCKAATQSIWYHPVMFVDCLKPVFNGLVRVSFLLFAECSSDHIMLSSSVFTELTMQLSCVVLVSALSPTEPT